MIHIDGSYGEGGGQILRTAIALSIVTQKPVEINNIRAKRPQPGLKPQHYTAVKLLQDLCQATTEDLSIGSTRVRFYPGMVTGGVFDIDVGTAGSISLIMQACLPLALVAETSLSITIKGGTDVNWSPSWDYFTEVFLRVLKEMNVNVKAELHQRGYYPKGGGKATLHVQPIHQLRGYRGESPITTKEVFGRVHIANLPDHIGTRMKHMVIKGCIEKNMHATIKTDRVRSASAGTGITLWMHDDGTALGVSFLGEKGMPAETVGNHAIQELFKEYESGASIDNHLFDQLIPYMVFAHGTSICRVRTISNHAHTHLWLIKQFIDHSFYTIIEEKETSLVQINGIG